MPETGKHVRTRSEKVLSGNGAPAQSASSQQAGKQEETGREGRAVQA